MPNIDDSIYITSNKGVNEMSIEIIFGGEEEEIIFNAEIDPHKAHGDQFPDGTTEEFKEKWFWASCGLIPRFFLQGYENLRKGGIIALNQSIRSKKISGSQTKVHYTLCLTNHTY